MLQDNIKTLRKAKGLSQEELAIKLNVVRQTVSKWESGLSVPDATLLLSLADALDTSVSELLGELKNEKQAEDIRVIAEKLEVINYQLAHRKQKQTKMLQYMLISVCILIVLVFAGFFLLNSPYLNWDYSNLEWAIVGVLFHGFEWIFIRVAPIVLLLSFVGIVLIRKNKSV